MRFILKQRSVQAEASRAGSNRHQVSALLFLTYSCVLYIVLSTENTGILVNDMMSGSESLSLDDCAVQLSAQSSTHDHTCSHLQMAIAGLLKHMAWSHNAGRIFDVAMLYLKLHIQIRSITKLTIIITPWICFIFRVAI
jgi:hypothetical protein